MSIVNHIILRKEVLIFAIIIGTGWNNRLFAFAGLTHKAITKEVVDESVLAGDYLDVQLGFTNKLTTQLELSEYFRNDISERVVDEHDFQWNITRTSILEWLKEGSMLEDVPNPRARHHFHDPVHNIGMDNSERPVWLINRIKSSSKKRYPDYWEFDATGGSSFDRAIHNTGIWETEYINYYYWGFARTLFYEALRTPNKTEREKQFGSLFFIIGHILHLLEDQGVPAHTRNDFIWSHMVGGFYDEKTRLRDGGNPFEIWVERDVNENNGNIPSNWLIGVGSNIPAFSSLKKYWDTDLYAGTYIGLPASTWGLAEQTNYQFLSTSTVFGCEGTLYQFPNPAESHAPIITESNKRYFQGYGLQHLARETYSYYAAYTYGYGPSAVILTKKTITPDDDVNVYNDYVRVTIPRTTLNFQII